MRPLKGVRSNIQPRDFFLDHCTDENAVIIWEDFIQPNVESLENTVENLEKEVENLDENLYHAHVLIEQILEAVNRHTVCKDLKNDILSLYDNSSVEL